MRDILNTGATYLKSADIENSGRCARRLLAHVLDVSPEGLFLHLEIPVSDQQAGQFLGLVQAHAQGKPISRIIGTREFWGLTFMLSNDTLDPRPDSESLIESVIKYYPDKEKSLRILDLGTGTGCLLLSLLHVYPRAEGVGVDCVPGALETAGANAVNLGSSARTTFVDGPWTHNVTGDFDVIISNPPYISTEDYANLSKNVKEYDPKIALLGGHSGLDCYHDLSKELCKFLKRDGRIFLEIGATQSAEVMDIFSAYSHEECVRDLAGHKRVLIFSAT